MKVQKTFISPLVELKNSEIHGKGIFAKENISAGKILIKWGGKFVKKNQLPKDKKKFLILQISENLYSVEPKNNPEDESYFINHSCNPNLWMSNGITFIARRNIKKGEEITTDYSLFESENYLSKWKCKCQSKNCRKKITGKDYLIPRLQRNYGKHFSPIILSKIKITKKIK